MGNSMDGWLRAVFNAEKKRRPTCNNPSHQKGGHKPNKGYGSKGKPKGY